jgi:hypothetical protein
MITVQEESTRSYCIEEALDEFAIRASGWKKCWRPQAADIAVDAVNKFGKACSAISSPKIEGVGNRTPFTLASGAFAPPAGGSYKAVEWLILPAAVSDGPLMQV